MDKRPEINGNQIAIELYGGGNVFQIRDSFGRKLLERDNREQVKRWLQKQPGRDFEIWELSGNPGELRRIRTATNFLHEHETAKQNGQTV